MDYLSLFKGADRIAVGCFVVTVFPEGGGNSDSFRLSEKKYAMLFCLQGNAVFELGPKIEYQRLTLSAKHLVALNMHRVEKCTMAPGTVILEYAFTGHLAEYMEYCSKTFHSAASSPVNILPKLDEWLERLVTKLALDARQPQSPVPGYAEERREMAELLMEYPASELKEIYAPIFACSLKCKTTGKCAFIPADE